jgi:hypothetical protein
MKKTLWILLFLLFFIILSNLPPLRLFYKENDCRYSNGDGLFTYAEWNTEGDNFEECKYKFQDFKSKKLGDTVLYRVSSMNILHYWDYGKYLFAEKYRTPFRSWNEIKAIRGPIINKSGFQHF